MHYYPLMPYLLWPAVLLAFWVIVYIAWIQPLRAKLIAAVPSIVEAEPTERAIAGVGIVLVPPTAWQKFVALVEGWKTIWLSIILSIFATLSAVFDALESAGTLGDLQAVPWANVFKPDVALKIVSALLVVVPIFHMVGKVKAAMAVPIQSGSAKAYGP